MNHPVGATHINTINDKYFRVEYGVIVKTFNSTISVDVNNGTLIEDCPWIVTIETVKPKPTLESVIADLRNLRDTQSDSVCDQYMLGLYNGLELALATAENREPKYLEEK